MEASRDELARFFATVLPHLNEMQRRVVTGAMSVALGRGGKSAVAATSGMSRNTVIKAEREVVADIEPSDRRGNPMSFLRWTSKSTGKLATELVFTGWPEVGRAAAAPGLLAAPAIGPVARRPVIPTATAIVVSPALLILRLVFKTPFRLPVGPRLRYEVKPLLSPHSVSTPSTFIAPFLWLTAHEAVATRQGEPTTHRR